MKSPRERASAQLNWRVVFCPAFGVFLLPPVTWCQRENVCLLVILFSFWNARCESSFVSRILNPFAIIYSFIQVAEPETEQKVARNDLQTHRKWKIGKLYGNIKKCHGIFTLSWFMCVKQKVLGNWVVYTVTTLVTRKNNKKMENLKRYPLVRLFR